MTVLGDVLGAVAKAQLSRPDLLARLGLALALGGAVGLEREVSEQPAGLRTHVSVTLGAALFGILSTYGFNAFVRARNDTNYQIDVSRVASQVVVGIGFLGAGAIIKQGLNIRGLTTAASLWATAAVGLAAGLGSYLAATATTGALLGSLVLLRPPRAWMRRRFGRAHVTAIVTLRPDADAGAVLSALANLEDVDARSLQVRPSRDGATIIAVLRGRAGTDVAAALGPVTDRDDVADVDIE